MTNDLLHQVLCVAAISLLVGCGQHASTPPESEPAGRTTASEEGQAFLLAAEPAGATDVIAVRESASDGDDVLIVGRIGGSANPWIDGRAAFSIVDRSLKACSDIEGDQCPQPWDYCCETDKLPAAMALIKVVDSSGTLVEVDARELLGVAELSTIVVQGKADRDEAGNLTVLASGVYVNPQ